MNKSKIINRTRKRLTTAARPRLYSRATAKSIPHEAAAAKAQESVAKKPRRVSNEPRLRLNQSVQFYAVTSTGRAYG